MALNLEKKFLAIVSFLKGYESIWNEEIIYRYPNHKQGYESLLAECQNMSTEELRALCSKKVPTRLNGGNLHSLIEKINELSNIPHTPYKAQTKSDCWGWMRVKYKKRHEISLLEPLVTTKMQDHGLTHIVDIGGGIGYFSQILANYHDLECTSLDADKKLQATGKHRNLKNRIGNAPLVNYVNHWFNGPDKKILPYFHEKAFSLGVHTCGPLANKHFECFLESPSKGMINFGCCYQKLAENNDYNISCFAKNNGLQINLTALTLATRSHAEIDSKGYEFKLRVKQQRYTLHRYLYHKLGVKQFLSMGSAKKRIYQADFAYYANEMFSRMEFQPLNIVSEELNNFADSEENRKLIHEIVVMGIIRLLFGRLIELYILLDRALYLQEKGAKVDFFQVFDEELSPRNIAIYATKN